MSAKHTPGPWEVLDGRRISVTLPSDIDVENCGYDSHCVALAFDSNRRLDAEANAVLIAAAPDLYDAADMAINTLLGCCVSAGGVDDKKTIRETIGMLREAIKKADGGCA